jgi:hypothetical protein
MWLVEEVQVQYKLGGFTRGHFMPLLQPPSITARKFFSPPATSPHLVVFGATVPDWYKFAHGYKIAAEVLISRLNERGVISERVCLPILFLYRHYVELSLKALLLDLGELTDGDQEIPGSHALIPLWKNLRTRLLGFDPGQESPWLDRAEVLIKELDTLDPRSFTFRYPVSKAGARLLPGPISFDMNHFREVAEELEMVIEGAGAMLDQYLSLKHEVESDGYYA